ncbi:hypothetical protein SPI_01850 [Niveomyces insectorum RCEF 264]|uniref:Uncharacterized protein n=1 Tax=Niveomyces insectorum RCEF 264 TaxID=1081102 RepID=A0A167ZAE7_9HYPO|nr:hypothetical protein SPI_01850 [Niveomyces insectorum RCEF 264]
MPSNKYSVEELLRLRGRAIPAALAEIPPTSSNPASFTNYTNRQARNDTRPFGRFRKPRLSSFQPAPILRYDEYANGLPVRSDDAVFNRPQLRRGTASSVPVETEWRYRGRTESEATASAEPLSAPTGLNAQRNEGFQRFYKAVVSPTHVRVTAGGRIVPNTRGTSPVSKRLKDKTEEAAGVPDRGSQHANHQTHQRENSFAVAGKAIPPFYAFPHHQFYPPFPGSMAPVSMMPLPVGFGLPGGFPLPPQPQASRNVAPAAQQTSAKPAAKENQSTTTTTTRKRGEGSDSKTVTSDKAEDKATTAPLEQFDHTKPFVLNGQVVYPFPASLFQQNVPPAMQGPLQMASAPFGHNGSSALTPATAPATAPDVLQPPAVPPISSIRPSEISRKQIEMLRGSLKYHEDQLLYNKHQIDEKEMEHTITEQQVRLLVLQTEDLNPVPRPTPARNRA